MGYQYKVAAWNDEYVKYLAERLGKFLDEFYEEKMEFVDDEGHIDLKEDLAWDTSLEALLEEEDLGGIIATDDFEELSHAVAIKFQEVHKNYFFQMADYVKEVYDDVVAYRNDPLGYYGMSQSDFL